VESARLDREKGEAELAELEKALVKRLDAEKLAVKAAEAAGQGREKAEAELAETKKSLEEKAGVEKQAVDLVEAARLEREKAEEEFAEKERLVAEQAAAVKQPAEPEVISPTVTEAQASPVAGEEEEEVSWGGEPGEAESGVTFSLDGSRSFIDFVSEEDVKDLYQSMNTVSVVLEAYPAQSCAAYVCVLEKKGAPRIYVALFLSENKKTLVFSPRRQPKTSEECEALIHGALNFVETIGFMMYLVELGGKGERAKILDKIPALRRTSA
jgi:hypothetical protein